MTKPTQNPRSELERLEPLDSMEGITRAEALTAESREQDALGGKPNQIEAVMAQLQKRPPNFVDGGSE